MQSLAALFEFQLVKLGAKNLHSPFAVLVLAALVLALNHNAGRKVRDTDGGFNFVNILAAVAAGAECVDTKIVGFHHDVDFVVDLGDDKNGSEGSVPAGSLVEGRNGQQGVQ